MNEIRIINTGGENLHIEIIPIHQGIDIKKPVKGIKASFEDPRIADIKKIIDRLNEDVAYHTVKHAASPKVKGPSGWVDMLDVLDDLAEALNENRG